MTITVHHLKISQSERAVWICEELGLDYNLVLYDRTEELKTAPHEYKTISPTGTAPAIVDESNGRKVVLAESGAIVEYLNTIYGDSKLAIPPSNPLYPQYIFWLHASNSSLMMVKIVEMVVGRIPGSENSKSAEIFTKRFETYLKLLDDELKDKKYIGGDQFTIADLMLMFPLSTGKLFVEVDTSQFQNVQAYVKRMLNRPAYRRAMQKCDPGVLLKLDEII